MADNYFCLDIGESFTKIVDCKIVNDKINIQTVGFIESDPTFYTTDSEKVMENQASITAKLVSSLKLTKKNVNIIIPDSSTYSQILEMPRLNEKELISAIRYQADQFIPMPIDETNIDLQILFEFEKANKIIVLMVAAPKKLIEKVQTTIESAGLIPDSIENELSATARFINTFYKKITMATASGIILVNLGFNSTSLLFFEPTNALLIQNHTFNIGYNLFLKEIQVNTNVDAKKSLEILRTFDARQQSSVSIETIVAPLLKEFETEIRRFTALIAEKKYQISSLYFINDIFLFPALTTLLEKSLSIPTKMLNPYGLCQPSNLVESHKLELPLFITTIGGNLR